jgi:hypothetical protein
MFPLSCLENVLDIAMHHANLDRRTAVHRPAAVHPRRVGPTIVSVLTVLRDVVEAFALGPDDSSVSPLAIGSHAADAWLAGSDDEVPAYSNPFSSGVVR